MRKVILLFILYITLSDIKAQNELDKSDDASRIAISPYIPDQIENFPDIARNILTNKLGQIVTESGLGGDMENQRFIITANIGILTKDITPTAPPMTALTLSVSLYIGDGIAGTKFSSTSLTVKGVGTNETKAYLMALKNINPTNSAIQSFVSTGKKRIIEYFNSNCDFIIKDGEALGKQSRYAEAIEKLDVVPNVCKDCYELAKKQIMFLYQKKIDQDCDKIMQQAQGVWNATQDQNAAKEASDILNKVDPGSKCFKEANNMIDMFYNEIKKRVQDLDAREWKLKVQQQKDDAAAEKERLKSVREIALAEAKQTKVVYNIRGWW